jgi:transcriptional regulator with XRE-family HTH domain
VFITKDIGQLIKQKRKADRCLTQQDFAALLGISGAYLSRIESGNLNVRKHIINKIGSELGFDIDWIVQAAKKPLPKIKPQCESCMYWHVLKDDYWGLCRFNPPIVNPGAEQYIGFWPETTIKDWCSKFSYKHKLSNNNAQS